MSEPTAQFQGREVLLERLSALGIDAEIVAYPKHTTIEEGKRLRGDLDGVFTKNLLLKDKKGRLFLVAAEEDNEVDLKSLHTRINARGRLRFASAEEMRRVLKPGGRFIFTYVPGESIYGALGNTYRWLRARTRPSSS